MKVVLLALAAAVLLAGCSGEEPGAAPPAPPPSSAAPSPTADLPALPTPRSTVALDREVEEAVLAYFAGINELLATGDPTAFDASYGPSCEPCRTFSRSVVDLYGKGQRTTARDVVEELVVAGGNSANAGAATVTFSVPAYRVLEADGSEAESYPESRGTRIFTVARLDGALRVVSIQDPTQ